MFGTYCLRISLLDRLRQVWYAAAVFISTVCEQSHWYLLLRLFVYVRVVDLPFSVVFALAVSPLLATWRSCARIHILVQAYGAHFLLCAVLYVVLLRSERLIFEFL